MQFFSLTVLQILIIPWSIRLLAEDRLRFILASRTWDRDLSLPSLILKASIKTYRTVSTFLQSGGEPWRIERQLGSSPSTSGWIRYEAGIYFAWIQLMTFAVRSLLVQPRQNNLLYQRYCSHELWKYQSTWRTILNSIMSFTFKSRDIAQQ